MTQSWDLELGSAVCGVSYGVGVILSATILIRGILTFSCDDNYQPLNATWAHDQYTLWLFGGQNARRNTNVLLAEVTVWLRTIFYRVGLILNKMLMYE